MTERRITKDRRKNSQLLTINQAADLIRVSRRTIYHWIKNGLVQTVIIASGNLRVKKDSLFRKQLSGDGKRE